MKTCKEDVYPSVIIRKVQREKLQPFQLDSKTLISSRACVGWLVMIMITGTWGCDS